MNKNDCELNIIEFKLNHGQTIYIYAENRFSYAIPKHEIICAILLNSLEKRTITFENLL